MSFQMSLLLSKSCSSFKSGATAAQSPFPVTSNLGLPSPLVSCSTWHLPHLGPSIENVLLVNFFMWTYWLPNQITIYCYSVNIAFINNDSKKVILPRMLMTATLRAKSQTLSWVWLECWSQKDPEKFLKPSVCLLLTLPSFSNWFSSSKSEPKVPQGRNRAPAFLCTALPPQSKTCLGYPAPWQHRVVTITPSLLCHQPWCGISRHSKIKITILSIWIMLHNF